MKRLTSISVIILIILVLSQIVGCGSSNTSNTGSNSNKVPTLYKVQTRQPIKDSVFTISEYFGIEVITNFDNNMLINSDSFDWGIKSLPFKGELKELWRFDLTDLFDQETESIWTRSDKEGWLIAKSKIQNSRETITPFNRKYINPKNGKELDNKADNSSFGIPDEYIIDDYAIEIREDKIVCFNKHTGNTYWDKTYNWVNNRLYRQVYIINCCVYILEPLSINKHKITKFNAKTGELVWEINSADSFLNYIQPDSSSSTIKSSNYLLLEIFSSEKKHVEVFKFDPNTLEVYKVNIDNIQRACSFKNYICAIDKSNKLVLIDSTTGIINKELDMNQIISDKYLVFEVKAYEDKLLINLDDKESDFDMYLRNIIINPIDNNYIDLHDPNVQLYTRYKTIYFESKKEIYGLDKHSGQKTWWIPKNTGIKDIKIIESRGILAYVEKDDFKGLVCFGQK